MIIFNNEKFYRLLFPVLFVLLVVTSCSRDRGGLGNDKQPPVSGSSNAESSLPSSSVSEFNKTLVFLENSASMDGYLTGGGGFQEVLSKLLRNIELVNDNFSFYLSNSKNYPFKSELSGFLGNLTVNSIEIGDRSTSDLNLIFRSVLDSVKKNNLGILISDGIYSISPNAQDNLSQLKISSDETRNHFVERLREGSLETLLLKFTVPFRGMYYPVNGKPVYLNQLRPFYIWMFATPAIINKALESNILDDFKPGSYQSARFFMTGKNSVNYTIETADATLREGSFRPATKGYTPVSVIKNAEKASRGPKDGYFRFSVAVDFSSSPLTEAYLLNPENYQVSAPYAVESVRGFKDLSTATQDNLQQRYQGRKYTHVISLQTQGNPATDNLKLRVLKNLPGWISATSVIKENDQVVKNNIEQTFGFEYLVKGISSAYDIASGSDFYYTLKFEIQN